MDVSASTCRLAAGRCSALLPVACDVRKLPFDADSFDLVVSLSTLDHFASVPEMEAAVRCLYRVLRPGGRLLITLDNLSNPLVRLRNSLPPRILQKVGLMPFPVGATLHPGQLRTLLEKVGFEVQDLTTLMHVPRAPAVALAALLDRLDESFLRSLCCRAWLSLELLSHLPTSRWTGNYVAASCSKGSSTAPSK
jgi:SAM-dependent methyltransferase